MLSDCKGDADYKEKYISCKQKVSRSWHWEQDQEAVMVVGELDKAVQEKGSGSAWEDAVAMTVNVAYVLIKKITCHALYIVDTPH